ncbi:putative zinc-ribbon domain plant domain-containing protein [Dioscorea alata]|uniref:Zinc-ribbon domain plant domain-containing protein n=1 Tax=Dioscorea alata TaxID=55571 RepID=A0ACB7V2K2_DIOAL|nr:putative zinc-ribbon domain plant domain-containing protein [Dioscorea alata]
MANNNTATKVRFVRCPKCLKILAEFSHIPVYRCGSCGMALKAKNISPLGQNQSQNQNLVEESIDNSVELNDSEKRESLEIERIGVNGGIKAEEVIEDPRVPIGSSEEDCNGGSGSFSSDNPSNGVPNKYRLMSKRTFRNGSNRDKGSISNLSISRMNNPSFDSEDFHSVQNLTEVNVDNQPSVKCQKIGTSTEFNSLEFDHVELMKKVDEIRDKVDILIDKAVNKERKWNDKSDRKSKSLQQVVQHVHCINCPPREMKHFCSHHHNACCHHSKEQNSRQHKTERKEDDDHKKLNLKQKKPANSKVYCLPVEKGAPFVVCSECMNVLHLPPDFLVSKKRWHKLQCGACSKILVFTFRPRAREGSSSAAEAQHPPTEASASNSNVSYTEEYQEFFLDKSYSLETQQFLCMPRNSSEINIERRYSSLHQLMGYDSASELLRVRSYSSDD